MLSAAGIFFIGCGITVYHGVNSLLAPHVPQLSIVTFVVLAVSFVVEGTVLLYAIRSVAAHRGEVPFFRFVREGADPATVAILLEDGAAVFGLLVAAIGIALTYATGSPLWDALGSIVVGAVLGLVALYLVRQNRELLLGRAVPEGLEDRVIEILQRQPSLQSVRDVKTRQLTPDTFTLKAEITFSIDYIATQLGRLLPPCRLELEGPPREAGLRRLAVLATELIANEIAAIERAVRAEIPQARHIDLEVANMKERRAG
jgi:zinc transporter 9